MNIDGTLLGFVVDGIMSGDPWRVAGIVAALILAGLICLVCWLVVSSFGEENRLEYEDITERIRLHHERHQGQNRKCSRKRKQ